MCLCTGDYDLLQKRALSIPVATLEEYTQKMDLADVSDGLTEALEACKACAKENNDSVWSYFQEDTLHQDNKLLTSRVNLICQAMSFVKLFPAYADCAEQKNLQLQWHLLKEAKTLGDKWQSVMKKMASKDSYGQDPKLFVWDLVCNIVASQERDA